MAIAVNPIHRRKVLQLTGVTSLTAISVSGVVGQAENDVIEFDDPSELLLKPRLLPDDGWTILGLRKLVFSV